MKPIKLCQTDYDELTTLLHTATLRDPAAIERDPWCRLKQELERATIVPPAELPKDTVRMHSRVVWRDVDGGEEQALTLVFPSDEDWSCGRVSVLAPVGLAILGYRVGDMIHWNVPGGRTKLKILWVASSGVTPTPESPDLTSVANAQPR